VLQRPATAEVTAEGRLLDVLLNVGDCLPEPDPILEWRKAGQSACRLQGLEFSGFGVDDRVEADGCNRGYVVYFGGSVLGDDGSGLRLERVFGSMMVMDDGFALLDHEAFEDRSLKLLQLPLDEVLPLELLSHCFRVHYLVFSNHCAHYIYLAGHTKN